MSVPPKSRVTHSSTFNNYCLVNGDGGFFGPGESEASSSVFTKPLFSARGKECGAYSWSLFNNLEEQGCRFGDYMKHIPFSDKWPVALFEKLEIFNKFRRRGLGRKGVKQFIQDARESGAVCCILQIGWSSDNVERERGWKAKFYASEGFIELENPSPYAPVLMYQQLKTA